MLGQLPKKGKQARELAGVGLVSDARIGRLGWIRDRVGIRGDVGWSKRQAAEEGGRVDR